jgi:hypothetical protein
MVRVVCKAYASYIITVQHAACIHAHLRQTFATSSGAASFMACMVPSSNSQSDFWYEVLFKKRLHHRLDITALVGILLENPFGSKDKLIPVDIVLSFHIRTSKA